MARKRKRPQIRWTPLLSVVLVGNVGLGLAFSPLTGVRRVRVSGAADGQQESIRARLSRIGTQSAAMVDVRGLESDLLRNVGVKSANFRRSLFGSARLTVENEQPIADYAGQAGLSIGVDGDIFRSPTGGVGATLFSLPADAVGPSLAIVSNWRRADVIELAREAKKLWPDRPSRIEVDSGGVLCLNSEGMARVSLGNSDRLSEKFARLERLIHDEPELLSRVAALNLSSPEKPAVTSKMPVRNR